MEAFSPDFATARERFREAARQAGCSLESHSIGAAGPDGQELTIDVALSRGQDDRNCLVVSSGLHGVEGYFGSAVQLAALERWAADRAGRPACRWVMIHAVNPYGMAWLRRFNEDNVDLNRNMLLDGQHYGGSPESYGRFNRLINPESPQGRWEPVQLKFALAMARFGRRAIQQAVTEGQYDWPRGLFFGGGRPSRSKLILDEHFVRWLGGSRRILHLDLHSGLGSSAQYQMLVDHPVDDQQRRRLEAAFGADRVRTPGPGSWSASLRGTIGVWGQWRTRPRDYIYAAAEFGTYSGPRVLAALRAENRCVQWGHPDSRQTAHAKRALLETFCPASAQWREQVLASGLEIVDQSRRALAM